MQSLLTSSAVIRLDDTIGYLLYRARKLSRARAEYAFDGQETSLTQLFALLHLRDGLADTCGGLARSLDHDSGAMTRMVDHLEERGLVRRRRSDADRRVVHLELTHDGAAVTACLAPRLMAIWDGLLAEFEEEETAVLTRLLQKLIRRLELQTDGVDA